MISPTTTEIAALVFSIRADPRREIRVLLYLEQEGIEHTGLVSGRTLALVCGVNERTWRSWIQGRSSMPLAAWRLLRLLATLPGEDAGLERAAAVKRYPSTKGAIHAETEHRRGRKGRASEASRTTKARRRR